MRGVKVRWEGTCLAATRPAGWSMRALRICGSCGMSTSATRTENSSNGKSSSNACHQWAWRLYAEAVSSECDQIGKTPKMRSSFEARVPV
jgi:hypothetical protein